MNTIDKLRIALNSEAERIYYTCDPHAELFSVCKNHDEWRWKVACVWQLNPNLWGMRKVFHEVYVGRRGAK